jgi:hypothetical protein
MLTDTAINALSAQGVAERDWRGLFAIGWDRRCVPNNQPGAPERKISLAVEVRA